MGSKKVYFLPYGIIAKMVKENENSLLYGVIAKNVEIFHLWRDFWFRDNSIYAGTACICIPEARPSNLSAIMGRMGMSDMGTTDTNKRRLTLCLLFTIHSWGYMVHHEGTENDIDTSRKVHHEGTESDIDTSGNTTSMGIFFVFPQTRAEGHADTSWELTMVFGTFKLVSRQFHSSKYLREETKRCAWNVLDARSAL